MTCVVVQRDRHEGEGRTGGAPGVGVRPPASRYQLQPTVFVDAIPELAAERMRKRD